MSENKDEPQQLFTWDDSEDPQARFLIIGNGFDIECDLPTSYGNFLDFVQFLEVTYGELKTYADAAGLAWPIDDTLSDPAFLATHAGWCDAALATLPDSVCSLVEPRTKEWDKFFGSWIPLFDNYWYKHFQIVRTGIGKDWVDFETEIARVIKTIEDSMIDSRPHQAHLDDRVGCPCPGDLPAIVDAVFKGAKYSTERRYGVAEYCIYELTYRQLRDRLLDDLTELTDCLERYLIDYVEKLKIKETQPVVRILDLLRDVGGEDTCVVSFNYTTTLERMLRDRGMDTKICYVHGRLGGSARVVLGMDEYLDKEVIPDRIDFASFRKYNQRILRRTDSAYMQWTKRFKAYGLDKREVIIFGHSLGLTDRDLLRRFMDVGLARTVVYYHSEDAFSECLANMTAMMGMDYVIDRTGPESNTLKFEDQRAL